MNPIGMNEFYPVAIAGLEGLGIKITEENKLIRIGKGGRGPDFVGETYENYIIGEIKSPAEVPTTSYYSWIRPTGSDTPEFAKVINGNRKMTPRDNRKLTPLYHKVLV